MSITDFALDPIAYASKYPFLVDESDIRTLQPATGAGNHEMLDAAVYQLHFDIDTLSDYRQIKISAGNPPGWRGLYFLPYVPDAATSMTLGADCDYFFTSALSGCTVQVFGDRATPTVTHANAGDSFKTAFAAEKDKRETQGQDEITSGEAADRHATNAIRPSIQHMLPDPGHNAPCVLTKTDYLALYDQRNFNRAKTDFLEAHKGNRQVLRDKTYKLRDMDVGRSQGRPEIGATVFGIRNFNGAAGWTIFYQATLGVQTKGRRRHGLFYRKTSWQGMAANEVVLGGTQQLFPAP